VCISCALCRNNYVCSRALMQLVLQARGVTPGLRHVHPILEAYAKIGASSTAETFVRDMSRSRDIAPDARCFELVARVS